MTNAEQLNTLEHETIDQPQIVNHELRIRALEAIVKELVAERLATK